MFSHFFPVCIRPVVFSLFFILSCSFNLIAQTPGSYRTIGSGDWNDAGVWEYYNGTAWTSATVLNDGDFSSGWTNVQVGGTNAFTLGANSGLNGVGDAGISITGISQAWYYKAVTLLAGQTYSVNFDYIASTNDGTNKRIGVAIRNTPPTAAQFVNGGYAGATYFFNSLVASTAWVNRGFGQAGYLTDFTPLTTGTYYLAIGVNQTTNTTVNLDNIVLRAIPSSASAAINIRNGHTVEINNSITIDQTTIEAGGILELKAGTITLNSGPFGTTDLLINGIYRRSSSTTITINTFADIVVGNGGTYDHNFAGGLIPEATWQDGSLLLLSLGSSAGGLNQSFYDVLVRGGTSVLSNDNLDRTMIVRNDMRIEGGTFLMKGGDNGGVHVLTILGNFLHSGGIYEFNRTNESLSEIRVEIGKDWIISGTASWAGEIASTSPTGTSSCNSGAYFIGTGEQTFSTILSHDNGDLRNRFYVASTVTGLHEKYVGSVPQYSINGSGGVCPVTTISGFSSWPTSGNLLQTFTINNPAGVLLRDNRNIKDTLYRTIGSITADPGDAPVEVISYTPGATLEYNGTSAITTESSEFPTANGPTNLKINNPGTVTLHDTRTIPTTGKLIFAVDNGLLITGTCNSGTSGVAIQLADNATVEGAGNTRFVEGVFTKTGNDAFTFPIGVKQGSVYKYAPVQISTPASVTDRYSACYVGSNPGSALPSPGYDPNSRGPSLTTPTEYKVSTCEYWHVNKGSAGMTNVSLTLSWAYGRSCSFANAADLVVANWTSADGGLWENRLNNGSNTPGPSSPTQTFGWVTSLNVINNWGTFTLAHPSMATSTLNNSLITLIGNRIKNTDVLEWSIPPSCFTSTILVECSTDGKRFVRAEQLIPKPENILTGKMSYEKDMNTSSLTYYRLKVQNSDGTNFYSNTVMLRGSSPTTLHIFPNPVTTHLTLSGELKDIKEIVLINQSGQLIYRDTNKTTSPVQIPTDSWRRGVYYLRVIYHNGQ